MKKLKNNKLSFYTGKSGIIYQKQVNEVTEEAFEIISNYRKVKFQSHITSSDTVLEYGIGTGWNLDKINCKKKLGYDIAEHLKPSIEARNIKFVSNIEKLESNSIDVILCHHVLEHLIEPGTALSEIHNLLKPDGKLLLYVPYEPPNRFKTFKKNDPNHHLYSWTIQSLGNLLQCCQFRVATCKYRYFGYEKVSCMLTTQFKLKKAWFKLIKQFFQLIRTDQEIFFLAKPIK